LVIVPFTASSSESFTFSAIALRSLAVFCSVVAAVVLSGLLEDSAADEELAVLLVLVSAVLEESLPHEANAMVDASAAATTAHINFFDLINTFPFTF
jgi:hypothetical protein